MKRPCAVSLVVVSVVLLAASGCMCARPASGHPQTRTQKQALTTMSTDGESSETESENTTPGEPPSSTKGVIDIYKTVGNSDIAIACVAIQDNGEQYWVTNGTPAIPLEFDVGTTLKHVYVGIAAIDADQSGVVDDVELCTHAQTLPGWPAASVRRKVTQTPPEMLGPCPPQ